MSSPSSIARLSEAASAQRAYDASMQAIQTYNSLNQRAVEVVRVK